MNKMFKMMLLAVGSAFMIGFAGCSQSAEDEIREIYDQVSQIEINSQMENFRALSPEGQQQILEEMRDVRDKMLRDLKACQDGKSQANVR